MHFDEAAISSELSAGLQSLTDSGCLSAAAAENCAAKLLQFLRELAKWNRAYNLTAVRDPQAMVTRHVLDSLTAHPFVRGARILDVGTGAGLPGIPLALTNPEKRFVLLDSNGKKTRFVQHAVGVLGLANVEVVHARIEQWEPQDSFDTVISRAFSSLHDFVTSSGRFIHDEGCLLAMKGKQPVGEIEALPATWTVARVVPVSVPGLDAERHFVILERRKT